MKFFYSLLFIFFSFALFSQSPDKINYQGLLRDGSGVPLVNTNFTIRFEILSGSPTGSVVFTEQQSRQTNAYGIFTATIGDVNNLGVVNWPSASHYLQVSVDPAGGTNFVAMGTAQQLLSVPYAQNANSVPATFSNNVLTIGNNNSFTLNASSDATLTGTGAATVTSSGNTHTIDVPVPTFTGAGSTTVTGTYPNYTINSQPTSQPETSLTASGLGTVTSVGTNTFDINVPAPQLSSNGNTLTITQGTAVSSATLPLGSTSITPQGALTLQPIVEVTIL